MAEEFRFEKTARDSGAIDFDESAIAARAEIVNGASEELLAGAGFAEKENGGTGGCGEFELGQGALEGRALADNFFKIEFAANFFLEIELFFGELIFQRFDFLESQSVFHGDGDLRGNLLKELHILRREGIIAATGEIERAKGAARE